MRAFTGLSEFLSFRWLDCLPGWVTLAVWGLVFALPPVALIIRFARGGTAANVFLCSAFTLAAAGVGILLQAHLRHRREDTAANEEAAKSRFRALLGNELKSRPLEQVNFRELIAGSGVSRLDADHVADEMFRRVAERFAQDGVITEKESAKLKTLAKALEMEPSRSDRIESEAKAARYHQAISEALADGTVTQAEAHLLNKLRWQLGVEDSTWTPGDIVTRD